MRRNIVLLVIALAGACADPSPSIPEPEGPSKVPATTQLPPPSNGIAGSGPDQAPLPSPEPAGDEANDPAKKAEEKPLDPAAPDPKTGSSAKCNSASTFSISEWKRIDATKKEVDFDVVANIEGSITLLDHESDAVIEADRDVAIDPVTFIPRNRRGLRSAPASARGLG